MKITSLQNSRVKAIVKLRSRSERDRQGVMLVEGIRPIERALAADWPTEKLYFCPELFASENASQLVHDCSSSGIETIECTQEVFQKIAYRKKPEGVIALAKQAGIPLSSLNPGPIPLILIAEGLEKPGNLGSILRIADGAGADAAIVCDGQTDINNPNVVRSSVGTIFNVPIIEAGSQETLEWLRQHGVGILAAMPESDTTYSDLDLTAGTAIVVGGERPGLTAVWEQSADLRARIPMLGKGDSLNVSISAAILLYEAVRQRGLCG